ncbi:hypothetical protein PtB15_8B143 [Puccinia triticina]|nr:hypothetical protein PtB15_8B143 [Puccinia triticina]
MAQDYNLHILPFMIKYNSDFEHVVEISSHTETFDDYRDHAIVNFPRESASNGVHFLDKIEP